jgi:hypothetical protein
MIDNMKIWAAVQPEPEVVVETVTLPAQVVEVPGPTIEVPGPITTIEVVPESCIAALYGLNDIVVAESGLLTEVWDGAELTDELSDKYGLLDIDVDGVYASFEACVSAQDIGI